MVCRATFRCEGVYPSDESSFQATNRELLERDRANCMHSQVLMRAE